MGSRQPRRTARTHSTSQRADDIATVLHDRFARLTRQIRNLELPEGMTQERLSALAVIDRLGPVSVTALADHELVRPATMSRMVTALVHEGLARRHVDRDDGRGVLVTTTAKGRRALMRANEHRMGLLRNALQGLSREQLSAMDGLASALERLSVLLNDRVAVHVTT
jgi:DNA-binding MarR family transcriptional regulator